MSNLAPAFPPTLPGWSTEGILAAVRAAGMDPSSAEKRLDGDWQIHLLGGECAYDNLRMLSEALGTTLIWLRSDIGFAGSAFTPAADELVIVIRPAKPTAA